MMMAYGVIGMDSLVGQYSGSKALARVVKVGLPAAMLGSVVMKRWLSFFID